MVDQYLALKLSEVSSSESPIDVIQKHISILDKEEFVIWGSRNRIDARKANALNKNIKEGGRVFVLFVISNHLYPMEAGIKFIGEVEEIIVKKEPIKLSSEEKCFSPKDYADEERKVRIKFRSLKQNELDINDYIIKSNGSSLSTFIDGKSKQASLAYVEKI